MVGSGHGQAREILTLLDLIEEWQSESVALDAGPDGRGYFKAALIALEHACETGYMPRVNYPSAASLDILEAALTQHSPERVGIYKACVYIMGDDEQPGPDIADLTT